MTRTDNIILRLATLYNRENTSNIYKLLSLSGDQLDELNDTVEDVRDSHFVGEATGASLDEIGEAVGLERQTGETDAQYRARILARVQGFIGGGTKDSIETAVSE